MGETIAGDRQGKRPIGAQRDLRPSCHPRDRKSIEEASISA
jgi:hypothetical protein